MLPSLSCSLRDRECSKYINNDNFYSDVLALDDITRVQYYLTAGPTCAWATLVSVLCQDGGRIPDLLCVVVLAISQTDAVHRLGVVRETGNFLGVTIPLVSHYGQLVGSLHQVAVPVLIWLCLAVWYMLLPAGVLWFQCQFQILVWNQRLFVYNSDCILHFPVGYKALPILHP